jgi:hypothetical protein
LRRPAAAGRDTHDQIDPDTQNERLFHGYNYTSTSKTLGVDVTGLNAHFSSYDVYVYVDADDHNSKPNHSVRRITDGTTTYYLDDPDGNTFTGTFVEAASTDPSAPDRGNYVVFRNVTADTFSIRVDDDPTLSSLYSHVPAIAGLQIVGGQDKDGVVITGDFDRDAAVGDNGVMRLLGGQPYEIASTDAAQVAPGAQVDKIASGDDADLVIGGNGDDVIRGQQGDDLILGDNARLLLFDGEVIGLEPTGNDPYNTFGIRLLSDSVGGNDRLEGAADDDLIYGQFGDDTFVFVGMGLGHDRLVEAGNGDRWDETGNWDLRIVTDNGDPHYNDLHDKLDFSQFGGPVDVDLGRARRQEVNGGSFQTAKNLDLTLFSGIVFEDVIGSQFGDDIDGNARNNELVGLDGNDDLTGYGGDDFVFGGGGHDNLTGDGGADVLSGGAGEDFLKGGGGRDVLLGGDDEDELWGGIDDDLLIGGITSHDDDITALDLIIAEWDSARRFPERVDNLRSGSGPILEGTGVALIASGPDQNVFDDGDEDELHGESGRDWFFADLDWYDGDGDLRRKKRARRR